MKQVYRVVAYAIAALVAVQAAAVAYGFFALGKFIEGGHSVDQSTKTFPGDVGLAVHGIGGTMVITAVALIFLILSFFAKIPGGVRWALITFVAVVVQVALGIFAHSVPVLGVLHGIVALVLFGVAVTAAMRVGTATRVGTVETTSSVSV